MKVVITSSDVYVFKNFLNGLIGMGIIGVDTYNQISISVYRTNFLAPIIKTAHNR